MKKLTILLLAVVGGTMLAGDVALAQLRPSNDPFESRRRDAEYRENLRRQQARAQRRSVPTFTIPQPAYNNRYYNGGLNNGFNNGFNNGGFNNPYNNQFNDPRNDPRFYDRNYVYVQAHYRNINGRLVYVPAHFDYVGR